jgi:hypothetical protein
MGSFCDWRREAIYLLPVLFFRDLAFSANSTSRRIASECEGLSRIGNSGRSLARTGLTS